ncbi:hypothetical protein AwErysi_10150 [Erysipelotrichaceae bacterium]|nr:hypothetical protein AwErysi_10150 [Erysipelotrichaceae bacterium]
MRKVQLTMNEFNKYTIIKHLVDTHGNKKSAALKIGCSTRTINRLILLYKADGKSAFQHGNRGKAPAHALSQEMKQHITSLYRSKYDIANFNHFRELLAEHEAIHISYTTIRNILSKDDILSPKAQRITKRLHKKKLKDARIRKDIVTDTNNVIILPAPIIPLELAHPRQERSKYFGESIQMDASVHNWFGTEKAHLHIAIDDATSQIVGAYFDTQETLHAYYTITKQMITAFGIPYQIVTD